MDEYAVDRTGHTGSLIIVIVFVAFCFAGYLSSTIGYLYDYVDVHLNDGSHIRLEGRIETDQTGALVIQTPEEYIVYEWSEVESYKTEQVREKR